jgi:outer membrane protein assembly factor BamB
VVEQESYDVNPNPENNSESMSDFNRRNVIKTTTLGLLSTPLLSSSVSGQVAGAEGPTVYAGTHYADDKLYAVNAETGEEVWQYDEGIYTPYSAPTVVDGIVYIGYDNGPRGSLHAVDAVTGEQEWVFKAGDWVRSSPTVVDGIVYVGSHDDRLYAIHSDSGEQKWEFELDSNGMHQGGPAVSDGIVYTGTRSGSFHAIDAKTGELEWKYTDVSGGEPTTYGDIVYFASDKLYALDAHSGAEEWIFERGKGVATPTVIDGSVFTASRGDDQTMYALDAATGDIQWETPGFSGRPTYFDGSLYVGSGSSLVALDAASGELQWEFTEPGGGVFTPTAYDGTVYIGSKDNKLYAVDTSTGSKEWEFTNAGHYVRVPTVVENPDGGDSVGSRVKFGLLGHHHKWADRSSSIDDPSDTYGFETGLGDWTVVEDALNRTAAVAYEGSYAAGINYDELDSIDTIAYLDVTESIRPSRLTFAWRETSGSFGGGILLRNAGGTMECFAGSNNPEWTVIGDNSPDGPGATEFGRTEDDTFDESTLYDRWIQTELEFDWTDSKFDATFTDTVSGETATQTFSLNKGENISQIELHGYTALEYEPGSEPSTDSCHMYWDEIAINPSGDGDDESDPPESSPYTDSEGYVDSEGLLNAGADYRNGEISADKLSEVASAFRSGEPLP